MNALFAPGAKRNRMIVAFGLSLLLATPAIVLWADKTQRAEFSEDAYEQRHAQDEARRLSTIVLPEGTLPPAEFSPFGGVLKPRRQHGPAAEELLHSPLGDVAWDPDNDAVLQSLKPGLRWGQSEMERGRKDFAARAGLNFVQLSQEAIDQQGLDAVMSSVSEIGTVVSVLPRRTLLVNVDARNMHLLKQSGVLSKVRALQPAEKLAADLGARPTIEKARAINPNLTVLVTLVPGASASEMAKKMGTIQGVSEITEAENGAQLQMKVHHNSLDKVARIDEVLSMDDVREKMTFNDENVPTIQAGSAEDANLIRPFDVAGVDGGGIDNGDGERINNGTDPVPPQIVVVTDNGISIDTPNFSQTATQPTTLTRPIGNAHRKIHLIQNVVDSGTSCDAQLSGAGTHGHIVASAIAAFPSQFGVGATRAGIGGPTQPRNENMDGVARGARIILQDAGTVAQCTINSLVERGGNVSPGNLLDRLNSGIGIAEGSQVHLGVMPFGAPSNFSTIQFLASNGTYPQEAADVDKFLYNNRDYMLFVPVGNNGGLVGTNRLGLALRVIPDMFNGTSADEDPNDEKPIQIPPPATAKNSTGVGSSTDDCFTFFGSTDCEQTINNFTSRGPATIESPRMVPQIMAPAFDLIGTPMTAGVAVLRSNDNDNLAPVDAQLDEGNFGSSFSAAYMTGAGAIIRDYFAQGFYPSGERTTANRVSNLSGTVVKAALIASADFLEGGIATQGQDNNERDLRRTRCLDLGTVGGIQGSVTVDIMCNSEQGYGRPVLTDVLPLSNWPDNFVLHPTSLLAREYPAAGLLVWDRLATGEPFINNTTQLSVTHTFRVASPTVITKVAPAPDAGAIAVAPGQLRIGLAWADPPGAAGGGGPLINDLDLVVESPGPDGNLATAADNVFYDGNRYDGGRNNANFDQWSLGRSSVAPVEKHEYRNNTEAVHLSADTNIDFAYNESPLYPGLWRVTVKRGLGGAIPGQITITAPTVGQDADQNEDDNNNGRLDAGEDNNGNTLLDQLGQPYSLVVSGPVFLAEAAPAAGPPAASYPASALSWDANRYGCSSNARLSVMDTTGSATPANVQASTSYQVLNAAGVVTDSETSFTYAAGAVPGSFTSAAIPVRLGGPAVNNNGILEADTGSNISATYARAGQAAITAKSLVSCSPDLINAAFTAFAGNAVGNQVAVAAGCDEDENLDAGEVVTYGVALQNRSKVNNYADLTATLTPSGPGVNAIRVLDSPKNMGTFPGNGINGIFFHVFVDPAIANALPVANRVVDMTLSLDSLVRGQRISRQSYTFRHAINSDRETFFYSTDFPTGGRQVRDINRNLVVDPPDTTDPFLGFIVAREDVTFSTLFSGTGAPAGQFTNQLGEDLDNNGAFSGTERNVVPNVDGVGTAILDKGVLNSNAPGDPNHRIPWNFDNNNGGWIPFRHPGSNAAGVNVNPLWEHKTSGLCGFQSTGGLNKFGIWHTGDGDSTTPLPGALACENHSQPGDPATPEKVELLMDVLESPIVAKVNQANDARGFSFTVEFQRFAYNENIQFYDGYAGGGVNIDNDIDSDSANSLLAQQMDQYYTRRTGGWPYGMFRDAGTYFPGAGISPITTAPFQRTFGPFTNTNGSQNLDGDETGFSGFTQDNNLDSDSPIPTAIPDFLAYPVPNAPVIGICDGGTQNDTTCDPNNPGDPCIAGGGACFAAANTVNGPVRNWDATLLGYEGGFASLIDNGPPENFFFFLPGRAGNRWQIGIGFWAMEGLANVTETDYGKSVDDAVFEWKEYHPQDEAALGAQPACARFNGIGQPQGGQCATITADRTNLYECDEGMEVTVYDAKCRTIGAGNTVPLGGPCTTNAQCGAAPNGVCTAALPSVQVQVVTDSDSVPVAAAGGQVRFPNAKLYTLNAVPGSPGMFRGTIIFSTTTNDANHAYTNPGSDGVFSIYYHDSKCDGDGDGQEAEDNFNNVDGDGVADANDICPQLYNPLQEDQDGDGFGNLCDNCPTVDNADQADTNADGIGDACEFDDIDGDGLPNDGDNCPDVRNPNQSDIEPDGRGDLCDTLKTQGVTFGTSAGAADCVSGLCTLPGDAIGDACVTDEDCIRSCNNNLCTQGNNGSAGGLRCTAGPVIGNSCTGAVDCGRCVGGSNPGTACASSAACTGGGSCSTGTCFNNFVSPTPAIGAACSTHAECYFDADREGDGVVDALDNCVVSDNGPTQGPNNQTNLDGDALGNVCDGDCAGALEVFRCRSNGNACQVPESNEAGVCSSGPVTGNPCNTNTNCGRCVGGTNPGAACAADAACTGGGTCSTGTCSLTVCRGTLGLGDVCGFYVSNAGSCSTVDDDFDADNIVDLGDNCGTVFNPAVIAGTDRQRDNDRDGIGDSCDPAGTFDDAQDGLPDDVVAFNGNIVCRTQPLAQLAVLAADYQDIDGDQDAFPDTGENGRIRLTLRNLGPGLTDATVVLTSSDTDVACITKPTLLLPADGPLAVGAWPNNAVRVLGDFIPGNPGFQFIASTTLAFTGPPSPIPTINFCITVVANETLGTASPICFSLLADLDPPATGSQTFTLGNDGLNNTADDGTIVENFDVDKNGDSDITVNDFFLSAIAPGTFRGYCSNAPTSTCQTDADCGGAPAMCYRGSYIRGDATGVAVGTVAATSCGGYHSYGGSNPHCQLDPDFPMDWHVHCAPGEAGTELCPNLETGTCVGGCSYGTPTNGQKSHSGTNSLHMGAHFNQTDSQAGDTTHFRALQGFQSAPMNLALFPRPGDLELSFYHIARLMDNNGVGPNNERQCVDCGDVQIQTDGDADMNVDNWGFWDKLVPFQNVYDHKPNAFSVFGAYYCEFTPTDTGSAPPNPRGVHETTCYPLGTWSRCGSTIGTVAVGAIPDCLGPFELDPSGIGVWAQTKFNLAGYLGQRVRLRWIAESWTFDATSSSYFEIGGTWAATTADDGWWLDDIRVTGTIQTQFTPQADLAASPGAACPSDPCNQALGGTDNGTQVILKITDLNGNVLDGVTTFPFAGQSIRVSAIDSSIPGGCVGGVAEYEFSKDGVVKQAFGPKSFYLDAPESSANYSARARCSTDFTCTSIVGATIAVNPYTGDGSDAIFANPPNQNLGVRYFRGVCTAGPNPVGGCNEAADCGAGGVCSITASTADDTTRYSVVTNAGGIGNGEVDLYRGTVAAAKGTRNGQIWLLNHAGGAAFVQHLAFVANAVPGKQYANTLSQAQDANPAVGAVQYYLSVGHAPGGNPVNALGCANPGVCANAGWCSLGTSAGAACNVNGDCPGGSCTIRTTYCTTDGGAGDLGGCARHQVCAGGANVGLLCIAAADCPGSSCAPLPANTPAGLCFGVQSGVPAGGCLPPGNTKRLVDQAVVLAP